MNYNKLKARGFKYIGFCTNNAAVLLRYPDTALSVSKVLAKAADEFAMLAYAYDLDTACELCASLHRQGFRTVRASLSASGKPGAYLVAASVLLPKRGASVLLSTSIAERQYDSAIAAWFPTK